MQLQPNKMISNVLIKSLFSVFFELVVVLALSALSRSIIVVAILVDDIECLVASA